MNEEQQDLKLTDLDYLVGDHHLQMMKAALPYIHVNNQRRLSMMVKMYELRRTMALFQDDGVAAMGLAAPAKRPTSPVEMLEAIKPYANTYEQSFIELIANVAQSFRNAPSIQSADHDFMNQSNLLDQFKNFLSPEQQSRLETMQFMIQTMRQIT